MPKAFPLEWLVRQWVISPIKLEINMSLVVISIATSNMPMHTKDDFEEWVKFNVGHTGRISATNPLNDYPIEAVVREVSHWVEPKDHKDAA